jgi:predicted lipoprotein with Yx(FWY)xxD motif
VSQATRTIALSPVEQALVNEVAQWANRAQAEIQQVANAKLAVLLDAHGMSGQTVNFAREGEAWVMVVPAESAADGA